MSLLLLFAFGCNSVDEIDRLQTATGIAWIATSPWLLESPQWGCVHAMADEWQVQLDTSHNLNSRQRPFSHEAGRYQTVPFDGGTLIGTDSGEFGGDVRWASADGDTLLLVSDNLVQFLRAPSGMYAFTGLAHLDYSGGHLWQIVRDTLRPHAERLLDLGDAPQIVALADSNTVLVITLDRLVVVTLHTLRMKVWPFTDWYGSYANSVVRAPNGAIYIGLRQGIARLEPGGSGYIADWLVPKKLADSVSRGCAF